jgi:transcriptional regulator with XRE-family HTH domain
MPSFINSTMKRIWKKMARKAWRDSYVSAHISNTIAAQITKLRMLNGWTQTQLAEHSGMKQSRISALEDPNWENVEIATLKRLASAFDVALTVRFIPFSELAEWASSLSEDKLLIASYVEEASKQTPVAAVAPGAAAMFGAALNAQSTLGGSVYNEMPKPPVTTALPSIPRNGAGGGALAAAAVVH